MSTAHPKTPEELAEDIRLALCIVDGKAPQMEDIDRAFNPLLYVDDSTRAKVLDILEAEQIKGCRHIEETLLNLTDADEKKIEALFTKKDQRVAEDDILISGGGLSPTGGILRELMNIAELKGADAHPFTQAAAAAARNMLETDFYSEPVAARVLHQVSRLGLLPPKPVEEIADNIDISIRIAARFGDAPAAIIDNAMAQLPPERQAAVLNIVEEGLVRRAFEFEKDLLADTNGGRADSLSAYFTTVAATPFQPQQNGRIVFCARSVVDALLHVAGKKGDAASSYTKALVAAAKDMAPGDSAGEAGAQRLLHAAYMSIMHQPPAAPKGPSI